MLLTVLADLSEPIQVELLDRNDCPWTDLFGPALIAIGAISAGILTAGVARRNHREQLAYDRAMRNRDATRDTVDVVVEETGQILDVLTDLGAFLDAVDRDQVEGPAVTERAEALEAAARRALVQAELAKTRLELRFPAGHDVPESYSDWLAKEKQWMTLTREALPPPRDSEDREQAAQLEREADAAYTRFLDACREWFTAPDEERDRRRRWIL